MVLILDGHSEQQNGENPLFMTTLKSNALLRSNNRECSFTCAPISEFASNMSAIIRTEECENKRDKYMNKYI